MQIFHSHCVKHDARQTSRQNLPRVKLVMILLLFIHTVREIKKHPQR